MTVNPSKEFQTQAARIILNYFNKMMALEKGTLKGADIECLHDMRTASRRLRARLQDFAVLFPASRYLSIQKEIRRITRRLGAARDVDVFEEFLKGECRPTPGVPQSFLTIVARSRERQRSKLDRFFHKLHHRGAIRRIRRYFKSRAGRSLSKSTLREYMESFAHQVVHPRLKAVEQFYQHSFTGKSANEDIHALRIHAKKLRYSMEIFEIFYGEEFGILINRVRALQDAAGRVHDLNIFSEQIRALVREKSLTPDSARPLLQYCALRKGTAVHEFRQAWRSFLALNLSTKLHAYWFGAAGSISG